MLVVAIWLGLVRGVGYSSTFSTGRFRTHEGLRHGIAHPREAVRLRILSVARVAKRRHVGHATRPFDLALVSPHLLPKQIEWRIKLIAAQTFSQQNRVVGEPERTYQALS